jgi:hypothetical protein
MYAGATRNTVEALIDSLAATGDLLVMRATESNKSWFRIKGL